MTQIRTRFAPSPTGFMHVGGVRTALFGWLFARQTGGTFILRIEDTDKEREVAGSIDHICESLDWLGLTPDEGPKQNGAYGPYIQSERLDLYRSYAEKLIAAGHCYIDPYSPEEIETFRQAALEAKKPFLYREVTTNPSTDIPGDWFGNQTLRFRIPNIRRSNWVDLVRGKLSAGEEALDDFVIIKADGYPTYNFAHVVDDFEMKISHIIRGEEFIPSTPKFLQLYEALEIPVPTFVTVPPILNPQGGKKLSKRDGARDVLEYRDAGYLPSTILNFLASLGWNDGTTKEIFLPDELIKSFRLERIQRSGAKFDETKLEWMEWQHRVLQAEHEPSKFLSDMGFDEDTHNSDFLKLALSKSRNRDEFIDQYQIFTNYQRFDIAIADLTSIEESLTVDIAREYVNAAMNTLQKLQVFSSASIEEALRTEMTRLNASPRAFLNLIRWCITCKKVSPNLFDMLEALGRQQSLDRLQSSSQDQAA